MVSRGSFRGLWAVLATCVVVLAGASAVSAAPACSVSVSPKIAAAGSVFTFHGSGFRPTDLTLTKNGTAEDNHSLNETGSTWSVAVRSRPGDEGSWNATFSSSACSAAATFTVTLSNTDVAPASTTPVGGTVPLPMALLVLVAGGAGGALLGRRLRGLAMDNRPQ